MPNVIVNPPQNQAALAALQAQIDAMQDYVDDVAAGGVLIDEATRDSDFTTTDVSPAADPISGLSVVVPASETRPVLIQFKAATGKSSAALTGGIRLLEDGVVIGVLCGLGDSFAPVYGDITLPPPDAEHTYTVEGVNASAGQLDLKAGSGLVDMALRAWRA